MENMITIVSGLPRSGTSMMMRMLDAGGMPVVVDHIRRPDEDNPVGYYEFEKVKKIKEDSAWLDNARGKAVKMISQLLLDLPLSHRYKIIFMQRDMQEILSSQKTMLKRRGVPNETGDEEMERFFKIHLSDVEQWLRKQPNIEILYVDYNDTMKNPEKSAQIVNAFLGDVLDVGKMAMAVDSALYRNRRPA